MLSTYITDSLDFIGHLRPLAEFLFVSYDVTSLYTNMRFEELITAVQTTYTDFVKSKYTIPAPPKINLCFL